MVLPILEKKDFHIDDSIFDGIDYDGDFKVIHRDDENGFPVVNCPDWENIIRFRIISELKNKKNKELDEMLNDNDNSDSNSNDPKKK